MRLFYCPKCKKEEIRSDNPYRSEQTILNMRDGYGRPIRHYKCECGNYLAGSVDFLNVDLYDKGFIEYCKDTIKAYNPGGIFYEGTMSLNGDNTDFYESAKLCYEERKIRDAKSKRSN